MGKYIKKGRYTLTPKAVAARLRGSQTMHERKFLHDRTSASVDKEVKYRAVELFGNVNAALVFAVEVKTAQNKKGENK